MKFFVTGVNGQLGHDVMNEYTKEAMRESVLISQSSMQAYRMVPLSPQCLMFHWI